MSVECMKKLGLDGASAALIIIPIHVYLIDY